MLEKEFKYYVSHQGALVKKYKNKYLVIKGEKVIDTYDNFEDALLNSQKKYKLGTFLIQLCQSGKDSYTQIFPSRVKFA
jgi:hypothetical protein